jgi:cellulose biosynthesis protein BcsQ
MSEYVVINSPTLRDRLLSLGMPISKTPTDMATASKTVYELALAGTLEGVIVTPQYSAELVGWLEQYAANNVSVLLLGYTGESSRCLRLNLPASLSDVITILGYTGINLDIPPVTITSEGDAVGPPIQNSQSSNRSAATVVNEPPEARPQAEAPVIPPQRPVAQQPEAQPAYGGQLQTAVLMSVSGKGGVGKTTIGAIQTANYARNHRGAHVLLIDGNAGQGDIRRYLKLNWQSTSNLPDIEDYQRGRQWRDVVVPSSALDAVSDFTAPIPFDAVLAPPHGAESSTSSPPAELYLSLVRDIANDPEKPYDLIVLDTQIIETSYTGVMVYSLLVPLLMEGAYAVGVFDNSTPGFKNTNQALRLLRENSQVDIDKFAYIANMLDVPIQLQKGSLEGTLEGIWVAGQIPKDAVVQRIISNMENVSRSPELEYALRRLTERVLGPATFSNTPEQPTKKGRGLSFLHRRG